MIGTALSYMIACLDRRRRLARATPIPADGPVLVDDPHGDSGDGDGTLEPGDALPDGPGLYVDWAIGDLAVAGHDAPDDPAG
jgi:hypothetical protein